MKSITLWQPWASLWLSPNKRFETRSWSTNKLGWILVHAAKRIETRLPLILEQIVLDEFGCSWHQTLPTGALIGAVRIIDCHRAERIALTAAEDELACGDFSSGRFAWERQERYCRFDGFIPYCGKQGFFNVPDERLPADILSLLTGANP